MNKNSLGSTEFLATFGGGGTLLANGFEDPDPFVRAVCIAGFALVACVYIWSRTKVKTVEE